MGNRRGTVTWRIWTVITAISIGALVVTGRLVQLQIIDHQRYAAEARVTQVSEETISDRRGALLDRNGYPLAGSEDAFDVMVEKRAWDDSAEAAVAANAISGITGRNTDEILSIVDTAEIFEIAVARGLTYEQAQAVRELRLAGVRLFESSRRVYPEGNLAAQLLGFVGRDNVGLTGLEIDLEGILGGAKGTVTFERDGLGNRLALGESREVASQPGANVVLTIDRYIQRLAEKELDATIKKHEATGGTIIVVQPKSGEILAMASRPTADVTQPDLSDESKLALFRNRAVTDTYEPGSVFKLVTMATALDLGEVGPYTPWYDEGVYTANGYSIRNWDFSRNGDQSVTQILTKSLNTGAAWLANLARQERFYEYVDRFGFGKPTGVGLSGEAAGRMRTPENDPENWRPVDLATNSFGQGISATPLQIAMAVATIANDGKAMKPQIVKEIAYPGQRKAIQPEAAGQVIAAETARTLREMMGVVVDGISSAFLNVHGYKVGGKTGTANLVTESGVYKPDTYISSFVGVAPLDDPALAILVKIDEPKGVPWGTVVAAPAFGRIVQAALAYMKVPPTEGALVSGLQ